jgi:hypothetical protein
MNPQAEKTPIEPVTMTSADTNIRLNPRNSINYFLTYQKIYLSHPIVPKGLPIVLQRIDHNINGRAGSIQERVPPPPAIRAINLQKHKLDTHAANLQQVKEEVSAYHRNTFLVIELPH